MPEGTLCNKRPIETKEELDALLSDKGGKQYYQEMQELEVDKAKLAASLEKTCNSKMRTWLNMCARCGLCAESCFLYQVNDRDPKQVPSYKVQSTLGEIVKRKGDVDNAFMRMCMDTAWSKCTCCNRCAISKSRLFPDSALLRNGSTMLGMNVRDVIRLVPSSQSSFSRKKRVSSSDMLRVCVILRSGKCLAMSWALSKSEMVLSVA
ncbi:MAG: 4Fe-4S dicluster domain-containing protein, partial [Desulfohalobium sp.]